jgi:hypothetical protein
VLIALPSIHGAILAILVAAVAAFYVLAQERLATTAEALNDLRAQVDTLTAMPLPLAIQLADPSVLRNAPRWKRSGGLYHDIVIAASDADPPNPLPAYFRPGRFLEQEAPVAAQRGELLANLLFLAAHTYPFSSRFTATSESKWNLEQGDVPEYDETWRSDLRDALRWLWPVEHLVMNQMGLFADYEETLSAQPGLQLFVQVQMSVSTRTFAKQFFERMRAVNELVPTMNREAAKLHRYERVFGFKKYLVWAVATAFWVLLTGIVAPLLVALWMDSRHLSRVTVALVFVSHAPYVVWLLLFARVVLPLTIP